MVTELNDLNKTPWFLNIYISHAKWKKQSHPSGGLVSSISVWCGFGRGNMVVTCLGRVNLNGKHGKRRIRAWHAGLTLPLMGEQTLPRPTMEISGELWPITCQYDRQIVLIRPGQCGLPGLVYGLVGWDSMHTSLSRDMSGWSKPTWTISFIFYLFSYSRQVAHGQGPQVQNILLYYLI